MGLELISTIVKGILVSVIAWVGLTLIINFVGTKFLVPAKLKDLVERGRPIYGKVIDKDAGDHLRIDYTYNVDGTEYTGSGPVPCEYLRFFRTP